MNISCYCLKAQYKYSNVTQKVCCSYAKHSSCSPCDSCLIPDLSYSALFSFSLRFLLLLLFPGSKSSSLLFSDLNSFLPSSALSLFISSRRESSKHFFTISTSSLVCFLLFAFALTCVPSPNTVSKIHKSAVQCFLQYSTEYLFKYF